jgi:signal transduction histidine kinase
MMPGGISPFDRVVAQFGRRALTTSDHAALIADIAAVVCEQLRVELSSVLALLPDGQAFFLAGVGWKEADQLLGNTTIELGGDLAAGHVVRTLSPLAIPDITAEQRYEVSPLLREHGVVSSLLVPLEGRTRPLGVLGAHGRQRREFSETEISKLEVLANLVSACLIFQEQQQAQHSQKLQRAEQMMAIGQVAAGVAHELRNPLTSIKGLVQVNLRDLQSRGLPANDLEVIEHEIRRMERTLQTFLDFARPPTPNRQVIDLATIAERVLALVGGRARKQGVALEFIPPSTPAVTNADFDQIQQLVLNLVLNALDAMPRGGRIEVELQSARDGFVELQVRDNGQGIAPAILPKVFETFVSSKETGVGLGLPLSRRIAEDHGGTLTAYNLPESGACFLLRLPAA